MSKFSEKIQREEESWTHGSYSKMFCYRYGDLGKRSETEPAEISVFNDKHNEATASEDIHESRNNDQYDENINKT